MKDFLLADIMFRLNLHLFHFVGYILCNVQSDRFNNIFISQKIITTDN